MLSPAQINKIQNHIYFGNRLHMDWASDDNAWDVFDEDDVIKLIQKANLEKIKMENTDYEKSNKNDILKQEYKIYSLRDALWFKQKYLKFELPDNIEYPIEYDNNGLTRGIRAKIQED